MASPIQVILGGVTLPRLEIPFVRIPIENSRDVETADGNVQTDFVSLELEWRLTYSRLTKEQYDEIYEIYLSQFETGDYPTMTIDYYNVDDVPVRMRINEKNIKNWGKYIEDVELILRETERLSVPSVDSGS